MATDTSSQPSSDVKSPTEMLQNYLQSRGLPLSSENMSRALAANARDPGVIPGLVNDVPSTDPGVGQSGNVAGQIEKGPGKTGMPVPPIPPSGGNYGDVE